MNKSTPAGESRLPSLSALSLENGKKEINSGQTNSDTKDSAINHLSRADGKCTGSETFGCASGCDELPSMASAHAPVLSQSKLNEASQAFIPPGSCYKGTGANTDANKIKTYQNTISAYQPKLKEPFSTSKADGWMALALLALGWLYYSWFIDTIDIQGWGPALFTFLFAAAVLGYSVAMGVKPNAESWFWCACLLLVGLSNALYPPGALEGWRGLFLHVMVFVWCISLFGIGTEKATGNWLPLDMLNAVLVIPFRNFALSVRSIFAFMPKRKKSEEGQANNKTFRYSLLGLLLFIPFIVMVAPMLLRADSGGFSNLFEGLLDFIERLFELPDIFTVIHLIAAILVGFYLFGLVSGSTHKRYTKKLDAKRVHRSLESKRILPEVTVYVFLAASAALYLVYLLAQVPYYFSAFANRLPDSEMSYANYARSGFFELCAIAAINLGLVLFANAFSRRVDTKKKVLRWLNCSISVLTLILIATAFSKMALYIGTYGLTPRRVLTSIFMLFLAAIWVGIIVLQFRYFPILRFAALLGSAIFVVLCLSNIDEWMVRYNSGRILTGTLEEYSGVWWDNPGAGGAKAVLEMLEEADTIPGVERRYITQQTHLIFLYAHHMEGSPQDTLTTARLRDEALVARMEAQYKAYENEPLLARYRD